MSEQCLSTSESTSSNEQLTKRKIELCRAYVENGYCRYGGSCFFAHGVDELQINKPRLKSKICRNYYKESTCRYGNRCNFKHERLVKILKQYPELIIMNHWRKKYSYHLDFK